MVALCINRHLQSQLLYSRGTDCADWARGVNLALLPKLQQLWSACHAPFFCDTKQPCPAANRVAVLQVPRDAGDPRRPVVC